MNIKKYYYSSLSILIGLILLFLTAALLLDENEDINIKEGTWRGEFEIGNHQVPFNFKVKRDDRTVNIYLLNSAEEFKLDKHYFQEDSIIIPIEIYDTYLIGKLEKNTLKGYFKKNNSTQNPIPFTAIHDKKYRFQEANITTYFKPEGKWDVTFELKDGEKRKTLGVFERSDDIVTGSILTTTGDYRFLEGNLFENKMKLSSFSGSNPLLIDVDFSGDNTFSGFLLTPGEEVTISGTLNSLATLDDPYLLTSIREGYEKLNFQFPNLDGQIVSLDDEKYKNKVVIVTIMGSWCPNCIDEVSFLAPWYEENKASGVEVIALSFEKKDDLQFAKARLSKLIERFDIQYEILFAGLADKKLAAERLPALSEVLSFPTTIFIDKNGRVRKIHTGFSGPATGVYYNDFITHFNSTVSELLNESI